MIHDNCRFCSGNGQCYLTLLVPDEPKIISTENKLPDCGSLYRGLDYVNIVLTRINLSAGFYDFNYHQFWNARMVYGLHFLLQNPWRL
jgi:hypothetical protein